MFKRILIANRGEVAHRIARTCDKLGITPVFAASNVDAKALPNREVQVIGGASPSASYLNPESVVQAARQAGCSAIHPGWGFLAESPRFAALCETHGITFIGPSAGVMRLLGRKIPAKRIMREAGVPVVPGSEGIVETLSAAKEVAKEIGYPLLVKAEAGGGGRGMRIAKNEGELQAAFEDARAEAKACFADDSVYIEKLIQGGRHIEIQLMGDRYGNVIHVGERDCTVQRNHQKLIEESPAIALSTDVRDYVFDVSRKAASSIGYVGAGTMEFLLDEEGQLRFIEMNTRLQVEHPVSEMRSGLDLVEMQLRAAAGQSLAVTQDEVELKGHSIECRINAENPAENFKPSPGKITKWSVPDNEDGVRIDTHVSEGYEVPPFYDSLLCKVIVFDKDRDAAISKMIKTLKKMKYAGVDTTIDMHCQILASDDFKNNNYDTSRIPGFEVNHHG